MEMPDQRLRPAPGAKFFVAVASGGPDLSPELLELLGREFGSLGSPSTAYCFSDFSSYYDAEIQGKVWKRIIGLEGLRSADELVTVKLATERIQWESARSGPSGLLRRYNLDPGYVNGWQVVLATVKNCAHRIFLRHGIYAEVTLLYRERRFQGLPWTYPDYLSPLVTQYLTDLRAECLELLRSGAQAIRSLD